jgi:hypothetical protein
VVVDEFIGQQASIRVVPSRIGAVMLPQIEFFSYQV